MFMWKFDFIEEDPIKFIIIMGDGSVDHQTISFGRTLRSDLCSQQAAFTG